MKIDSLSYHLIEFRVIFHPGISSKRGFVMTTPIIKLPNLQQSYL